MTLLCLLLLPAACGGDGSDAPGDSAPGPDTLAMDGGIPDSAPGPAPDAAPNICSTERPDGPCPTGRVCREGACIVDLDPGQPPPHATVALDLMHGLWSFYDEGYGAFSVKSVDWDAVKLSYTERVQQASSAFELRWTLTRMVAEIGDGHTYAMSAALCQATEPYGRAYSNVGACVTEVGSRLLVYRVTSDSSDFQLGDELLRVDGRPPAALLHDAASQPRCLLGASTPAMARAQLVDGLLLRAATDQQIVVRRAGADAVIPISPTAQTSAMIDCDGVIGLKQTTLHKFNIRSRMLTGDLLYVRLPMFGGYDSSGAYVVQPVIDELRQVMSQSAAAKGLMLDLRANPGGSPQVYLALASWLYATPTTLFTCRSKTCPGHADLGPPWPMSATPDPSLHYAGPLAVLVSPRSFSAADFTSAFLQLTGRARSFGAPSGGGFGNGGSQAFDSDWSVGVNDILCSDLAGNPLEGTPPAVDQPVAYSPADIAQGRDSVIEAARAWLQTQTAN